MQPDSCRASIATTIAVLIALFFTAVLAPGSGVAAASSCPAAKREGACGKTSKRLRYKTVRKRILVSVPHATREEGLSQVVTVSCPHGEKVVGGGTQVYQPYLSVKLSAPDEATTGWSAQVANFSTTTDIVGWVRVYAVCELPPAG